MSRALAAGLLAWAMVSTAAADPLPRKPATRQVVGGKRVVKVGGESRAWSTLKPVLPEGVVVAGEVNVAALRGTETLGRLRQLISHDEDTRSLFDAARSGCQIDLGDVINDVAFALVERDHEVFMTAVSLRGLGEADLVSCVESAWAKKGGSGKKLEVKHSGGISDYSVAGENDHIYAAWLAPDVVAFTTDANDRSLLAGLLTDKGGFVAKPGTRRALAATVPGATAWMVMVKGTTMESYEIKVAAGSLSVAGGQLSFDVSVVVADAESARKAAAEWTAQRDQLAAGGGAPALLGQLIKAVQIAAADDVVRITAAVSEKDFFGSFPIF